MLENLIHKTQTAFQKNYGIDAEHIFLSPGRINIIGEHVDCHDGFVLPAAIDKYICIAVKKQLDSDICTIKALDFDETINFDISKKVEANEKLWGNYILGVIRQIQDLGKKIGGFQAVFSSNIPMGSGLSSSAALECGFGFLLNSVFDLDFSKEEIAVMGQRSEHTFVGVNCGIMDQFASVFGQNEKVILLNCDSLEYQYYNAEFSGCQLVLFDSRVKHSHLSSGYNDRRNDMEIGKEIIKKHFPQIQNYRDVTEEMLNKIKDELGKTVYKRCLYVVKEIKRVEDAVKAIQSTDFETLGNLITETHHGLSTEYEVSCEELDFLVRQTLKQDGVLGARMMGGGFGGCSINLIENEKVDEVISEIQKQYQNRYNIEMMVYKVKISEGTREYIENEISI